MAKSQWQKIADRNAARLLKAAQESFVGAAQQVIAKSPVDKGTFINNWFTEINSYTSKTVAATGKAGTNRLKEAISISKDIQMGDYVTLANALPYAIPLEYGHSEKAPSGMVRIVAANWSNIVAKAAKGVRNDK